jgi:Na+-driven multidrug efflux pump
LQKLTYRAISLLYLPLAASWVLMLAEAPLVNAFLARGPDPELSLAAFGVAFSIILVVEAPILMMLELSIALSKSMAAFRKIRLFYLLVVLGITALGLLLFYTPLCQVVLCGLMGIPPKIAEATAPALRVFVWWPLPIGWRRIYQGILISDGRTRIISVATAVRLVVLLAAIVAGQSLDLLAGATLATVGMVLAVTVEAGLTHWAAQSSMRRRLSKDTADPQPIAFRYLWSFYLPLAITTVLRQMIRPVISAGIAGAPMAELSLAAFPVAFSLSSIFWGPTMALRQVTVALTRDKESWHKISRFVLAAGLALTAALCFIGFTPLLDLVLRGFFGLSESVAALAAPATRVMVLLPLAYTLHALFTGLLVKKARTSTVRTAKILDLGVVALALFLGLGYGGLQGSVLGAIAITSGALVEAVWLYWRSRETVRSITASTAEETTV